MTFKGILDQVQTWAARHGLPVFFGDDYTRNFLSSQITGDFVFVDVPGGVQDFNDYTAEEFSVNVLIQVLGTTAYERDRAEEIEVLDRTFTVIVDLAQKMGCNYTAGIGNVTKRQNIYDSPKSGWELVIAISE